MEKADGLRAKRPCAPSFAQQRVGGDTARALVPTPKTHRTTNTPCQRTVPQKPTRRPTTPIAIIDTLTWAAIAIAILLTLRAWARHRRSRQRYAELAKSHHLNYTRTDRLDLPRRYRDLTLFQQGHNRCASHVISGTTPHGPISCFRYDYEAGSGTGREPRTWGVAVIESDLQLPPLSVLPTEQTTPNAAWNDATPQEATQLPLAGDVRVFRSMPNMPDSFGIDWCTALPLTDPPAGLEARGRLIAVFAPDHAPPGIDRLITLVSDAADRLTAP